MRVYFSIFLTAILFITPLNAYAESSLDNSNESSSWANQYIELAKELGLIPEGVVLNYQ